MAWVYQDREITKEDFDAIKAHTKGVMEFFDTAELAGYGAIPSSPYEKDGKYFIPYGISTSCD